MSLDKLTGSTLNEQNVENKIHLGSKIVTVNANDNYTLVDAFNIDWSGYKLGDNEFHYTGDVLSYINSELNNKSTATSEETVTEIRGTTYTTSQITIYKSFEEKQSPGNITPSFNYTTSNYTDHISELNRALPTGWSETETAVQSAPYLYMSSCYRVTALDGTFKGYVGPATTPIYLPGETAVSKPADYYQTRYTRTTGTELGSGYWLKPNATDPTSTIENSGPAVENISINEQPWSQYISDTDAATKPNIWQSTRKVTWTLSDGISYIETWAENSRWSTPFMLNTIPTEARAIHPCLLYKWDLDPKTGTNGYTPTVTQANTPPGGWNESPNTPTTDDVTAGRIFLWMIQGEYKIIDDNGTREYQLIDNSNYWTNPVCLSGADGKPGEDGDDIEFIYKAYSTAYTFDPRDTTNNPAAWYTSNIQVDYAGTGNIAEAKPDYTGPDRSGWYDNASAQVVSPSQKYVYCSYRRSIKINNVRYWEPFSQPFPWSVWGENGIDGDGVEYIYWRCNEYPVQSGHEWNTNAFNPNNWELNATDGKNDKDFQDDDYLGPNDENNKWTDEPKGVSLSEKYEYVSIRKKIQDPNDPKKKIWGVFSTPSLWSNFAEDGVATNMVLETDNDNVTVGIDGDGLVNNDYSTSSNIYLRYNGISQSAYDLSLDITILLNKINSSSPLYGKLSCTNSNRNLHWNNDTTNGVDLISINNSTKTIAIVIPKNFPIGAINNLMEVQLCATTNAVIGDVQSGENYTRIFTVSGVELSIEDIYQIGLNTTTPHRNANNDGFDAINLWLSSFTSTNIINNANDAAAANMFVTYYSTNKNISAPTGSPNSTQLGYLTNFNVTLNPYYNKHIFIAYYNSDVSSINDVNIGLVDSTHINNKSTKFLDSEEATAVYDGTNGVDSRSEEYIYLLTNDIDFLSNHSSNNYYVPSTWHETGVSANYQNDDFPFNDNPPTINGIKYAGEFQSDGQTFYKGDDAIILTDKVIGIWTDNPQGVSEEYPYEFRAARHYDTSKTDGSRWQAFENPVIWANWGHSGEDGDGVEYIYYRSNAKVNSFTGNSNPQTWVSDSNYQDSEYIKANTNWMDCPKGVNETNKYEYVSIRKYKHINIAKNLFDAIVKDDAYWINHEQDFREDFLHPFCNKSDFLSQYNAEDEFLGFGSANVQYSNTQLSQFLEESQGWLNTHFRKALIDTYYAFNLEDVDYDGTSSTKIWTPYSEPTIWAKYGEQGPSGSSGLTIDFDNPTLQVAVNNNGIIKDNQTLLTYIHLYEGSTDKSDRITSVTIPDENNSLYHPFNTSYVYQGDLKFYKTVTKDSNNTYYYKFVINDLDVNNNGEVDTGDYFPSNISYTLNSNLQMPFTIHYNGNEYTKYLTFTPIHYGKDGQDAELFEMSSETSVIRYNNKLNTPIYEPDEVEYKIHHVKGSNDADQYVNEIIPYDTNFVSNYLTGNESLNIYYYLECEGGTNAQQYSGGEMTGEYDLVNGSSGLSSGNSATTHIYSSGTTSTSASGIYIETPEAGTLATVGGTREDVSSVVSFKDNASNVAINESGKTMTAAVPVVRIELDSETAEETILSYVNESVEWENMLNDFLNSSSSSHGSGGQSGGLTPISGEIGFSTTIKPSRNYDTTNISEVSAALADYAQQLEVAESSITLQTKSLYTAERVWNASYVVGNVASELGTMTSHEGTIKGENGNTTYTWNSWELGSNVSSILVQDTSEDQNIVVYGREDAILLNEKESQLKDAVAIVNDIADKGETSDYYNIYHAPGIGTTASDDLDDWVLLKDGPNGNPTFTLDINNLIKKHKNWNDTNVNELALETVNGKVTLIKTRLVYNDGSDNLTTWDEDSLEIVYDGVNGADSESTEYIYYCPGYNYQVDWTTIQNNGDASENPEKWTASNTPDYLPDGNIYIDDGTNGGWSDHPHGVDETHPYEYISQRTKNAKTGNWSKYERPVVWSHYGEKGRDGDGVEYIFKHFISLQTWGTSQADWSSNPALWSAQQQSEYLGPTGYEWSDDPQGVTDKYLYEYVAVRKYNGDTGQWGKYGTPSLWAKYGEKGDTGDPGADAYVIDWTNDQINLAVDADGYIIGGENGQLKETSININSLNGVFGDNPTISMTFATTGTELPNKNFVMPWKFFTKNYTTSSENNVNVYVESINYNTTTALNSSNIYCLQGDNSTSLIIIVGKNYPAANASDKAYIPTEGLELYVKVLISGNNKSTTQYKVLRVCGQHIAQDGEDGENAVTYEIIPTINAVNYSSSTPSLSYFVNKYDGLNITQLTSAEFSSNNLCASWTSSNATGVAYTNSLSSSSNIYYQCSGGGQIYLKLWKGSQESADAKLIDSETIPVLKNGVRGESGSQGFTGPIVRMRGQVIKNSNTYYGNGEYNKSSNGNQYDGVSPLYKDIVTYTWANGTTKYYTPKTGVGGTYIGTSTTYLCTGSYYVSNTWPANPDGTLNGKWTIAQNFDFVATKLLYADQALINQISSHDFIATTQDGTPVAGMTSGKKEYGKDNESLSLLNNANNGNVDTGGDDTDTLTDTSHVRIFAGQIWNDNNSYSLTYAPFNVRQDGTTYMSKANIIGDVNIGGQVNIGGNVNIEGNAKVKADVNVNTLTLNSGSFIINSDCTLPTFKEYEHKIFYILIHHNEPNTKYYISPNTDQKLLAVQNNGFTEFSTGIEAENQGLYTAISTYIDPNFYWIISKTGIYSVPTGVKIKKQIYRDNINNYITFEGVEVAANKALKVKFKQKNKPQCSDTSYSNIQSVTLYCNINNSLSYQVAVQTGGVAPWIYNSTKPSDVLSIDETSDNLDHHYCSGSTTVNGWNENNTDMNIDLWWIDPRDGKEAGDLYRIIKYNDTHGWSIDDSHNTSNAITNSSTASMFNYYISVTFYSYN